MFIRTHSYPMALIRVFRISGHSHPFAPIRAHSHPFRCEWLSTPAKIYTDTPYLHTDVLTSIFEKSLCGHDHRGDQASIRMRAGTAARASGWLRGLDHTQRPKESYATQAAGRCTRRGADRHAPATQAARRYTARAHTDTHGHTRAHLARARRRASRPPPTFLVRSSRTFLRTCAGGGIRVTVPHPPS